jgi:hypothetical protein
MNDLALHTDIRTNKKEEKMMRNNENVDRQTETSMNWREKDEKGMEWKEAYNYSSMTNQQV